MTFVLFRFFAITTIFVKYAGTTTCHFHITDKFLFYFSHFKTRGTKSKNHPCSAPLTHHRGGFTRKRVKIDTHIQRWAWSTDMPSFQLDGAVFGYIGNLAADQANKNLPNHDEHRIFCGQKSM